MIVTAQRGGGIAGPALRQQLGPVDTAELPFVVAERMITLVEQMDFFSLPDHLPDGTPGHSDAMWYSMAVELERTHTIDWTDNAAQLPQQLPELTRAMEESGAAWTEVST
jgi:hypothetical protein